MATILHQKGANGLIAEYQCAVVLNDFLQQQMFQVATDTATLNAKLQATIGRVGNELTEFQVRRALAQGQALAEHIGNALVYSPGDLGLVEFTPGIIRQSKIAVSPVGHDTNSGTSADINLFFESLGRAELNLPISLKAYGPRDISLGSKSAKAALARMFLGKPRVTDAALIHYFGEPAIEFTTLLKDFKGSAKEFYNSPQGAEFVRAYQQRKGLPPTAKVNNPFRRKEVGDYFISSRGYRPEHRFAQLYVQMFDYGITTIADDPVMVQ
ncbi:MAG: hypothetical protein LBB58_01725, partial [Cellulomonadaceae bacterium]|nr:hypothetical protein [Cellulomonadaceae bacterium]